MGPVAERLRDKLQQGFEPEQLEITDDSARHAGHRGASPEGESHFSVTIVSPAFAGLSRVERQRRVYAATGDRPTWQFKASKYSREAAAFAANAGSGQGYADPLGIFRASRKREQPAPEGVRHLGRLERNALADLDLADTATAPEIRARYTELIKRCHPDTNGGDRSAEHKLQRVLKAYKTLRQAKLV